MVTVTELWIYPVKSCGGIALERAVVTHQGFLGDRQWMIVDPAGHFLTQRQYPQLARVRTALNEDYLSLSFDDVAPLHLSLNTTQAAQEIAALQTVTIWRNQVQAVDQGDEAAAWLSGILQTPCRLVRQSTAHIRPINPKYALWENQPVSFADGYPVLLTNTASLQALNDRLLDRLESPLSMDRFRPNLVVTGDRPFAEDEWQRFTISNLDNHSNNSSVNRSVEFVLAKPCERCIVTTTDQTTGDRHPMKEPLRTLQTFRYQPDRGILFGTNLMPTNTGEIAIGDRLTFP